MPQPLRQVQAAKAGEEEKGARDIGGKAAARQVPGGPQLKPSQALQLNPHKPMSHQLDSPVLDYIDSKALQ